MPQDSSQTSSSVVAGEKSTIGFGVIGLGIGQAHIAAIHQTPGARLVAVASTDAAALQATASREGVPGYADYHELLDRPDVDVVCVCTPSGTHARVGIDAARAGKNVLCEKPLDISLERADELIEACNKAGVKLAAVFQFRFHPLNRAIKQAIDSGRLGRMIYADDHLYWFRAETYFTGGDPAGWHGTWALDGGGAFINQGIHGIDLIQWLVGPVQSVFAKSGTFTHHIQTEDVGTAILTFENGALGNVTCTTSAYPGLTNDFHFVGENGTIVTQDNRLVTWRIKGTSAEAEEAEEAATIAAFSTSGPNPAFDPRTVGGHGAHIADIIAAIRENRAPELDGRSARRGLALALAIIESARKSKEVEVAR